MVLTAACFFKDNHYLFTEIWYVTNPFVVRFWPLKQRTGVCRFSHPHKYKLLRTLEKSEAHRSHWKHGRCFQASRHEVNAFKQNIDKILFYETLHLKLSNIFREFLAQAVRVAIGSRESYKTGFRRLTF